jgi:hypothetical protein
MPSTSEIAQKCRQVRSLADDIGRESRVPDVSDLCTLISGLAQQLEYVAEGLQSVGRRADSAFGTIAAHLEEDHPDSKVL